MFGRASVYFVPRLDYMTRRGKVCKLDTEGRVEMEDMESGHACCCMSRWKRLLRRDPLLGKMRREESLNINERIQLEGDLCALPNAADAIARPPKNTTFQLSCTEPLK